jgi:hypothetical protein
VDRPRANGAEFACARAVSLPVPRERCEVERAWMARSPFENLPAQAFRAGMVTRGKGCDSLTESTFMRCRHDIPRSISVNHLERILTRILSIRQGQKKTGTSRCPFECYCDAGLEAVLEQQPHGRLLPADRD